MSGEMDMLALQALLSNTQSDETAALKKLEQAILLAEPGGFIRLFVDLGPKMAHLLRQLHSQGVAPNYIEQILAAFASGQRMIDEGRRVETQSSLSVLRPSSPLIDPLTDRELEVMALLAQRLSNKEIAAELIISPATVRTYTYNIYQKLNVNSRRQAVSKATELGILPPD